MSKDVIGLGLESSCDETAASVVKNGREILSNIIYSQIDLHRDYNGVVPEIASRSHLEVINSLIDKAMKDAGVNFDDLDYVSTANRPGLIGSLIISLQSAKAAAYTLGIPLITVSHLEAHMYAPYLEGAEMLFPCIGLLVSGGNTALFKIRGIGDYEFLGRTRDDAAGEALDKAAKFMNLGYPGGPEIEKAASRAIKKSLFMPKLLADSNDYNFSYSGLKTALVNYCKKNPDYEVIETAYSFQERALELLVRKSIRAAEDHGIKRITAAGGVTANKRLREIFKEKSGGIEVVIPSPVLCTDNAAMTAGLGYHYFISGNSASLESDVFPRE